MAILNVTPGKNYYAAKGQLEHIPGELQGAQSINITADSTATALPTLGDGTAADYYRISTDAAMYVIIGTNAQAGTAADGTGILLASGESMYLPRRSDYTHIGKGDKV